MTCCFAGSPVHAEGGAEDAIAVPSGLHVVFHDIHRDTLGDGLTYRFRFVAPQIGEKGHDYLDHNDDMDWLCSDYALSHVSNLGPRPNRIVITLMAEPVPFGVASPTVIQFFESYSVENDLCIWEAF